MRPNAWLIVYRDGEVIQTDTGFGVSGRVEAGRTRVIAQPLGTQARATVRGTEYDHSHRLYLSNHLQVAPGQYVELHYERADLYAPLAGKIVSIQDAGVVEMLATGNAPGAGDDDDDLAGTAWEGVDRELVFAAYDDRYGVEADDAGYVQRWSAIVGGTPDLVADGAAPKYDPDRGVVFGAQHGESLADTTGVWAQIPDERHIVLVAEITQVQLTTHGVLSVGPDYVFHSRHSIHGDAGWYARVYLDAARDVYVDIPDSVGPGEANAGMSILHISRDPSGLEAWVAGERGAAQRVDADLSEVSASSRLRLGQDNQLYRYMRVRAVVILSRRPTEGELADIESRLSDLT